jgi:hypothetical protein
MMFESATAYAVYQTMAVITKCVSFHSTKALWLCFCCAPIRWYPYAALYPISLEISKLPKRHAIHRKAIMSSPS